MKLTSKGRYAVMAMADLAKNCDNKPTSLAEISIRQGISLSFLEHPASSKAAIVISSCFISLQLSILHPSCRRVYGGGQRFRIF